MEGGGRFPPVGINLTTGLFTDSGGMTYPSVFQPLPAAQQLFPSGSETDQFVGVDIDPEGLVNPAPFNLRVIGGEETVLRNPFATAGVPEGGFIANIRGGGRENLKEAEDELRTQTVRMLGKFMYPLNPTQNITDDMKQDYRAAKSRLLGLYGIPVEYPDYYTEEGKERDILNKVYEKLGTTMPDFHPYFLQSGGGVGGTKAARAFSSSDTEGLLEAMDLSYAQDDYVENLEELGF